MDIIVIKMYLYFTGKLFACNRTTTYIRFVAIHNNKMRVESLNVRFSHSETRANVCECLKNRRK